MVLGRFTEGNDDFEILEIMDSDSHYSDNDYVYGTTTVAWRMKGDYTESER